MNKTCYECNIAIRFEWINAQREKRGNGHSYPFTDENMRKAKSEVMDVLSRWSGRGKLTVSLEYFKLSEASTAPVMVRQELFSFGQSDIYQMEVENPFLKEEALWNRDATICG